MQHVEFKMCNLKQTNISLPEIKKCEYWYMHAEKLQVLNHITYIGMKFESPGEYKKQHQV
jgi:hypothetical protein